MILDEKQKSKALNCSPQVFKAEVQLPRKENDYKNLSDKFVCSSKDFSKQFAHIYAGRLNNMKDSVVQKCVLKWGKNIPIHKLSELPEDKSERCIVIGTLFKHQELKPSILKEISEENQLIPQPLRSNYVSDNDQLILEDEIQRIRLIGVFDMKKLVTGIVVALLGSENQEGKFVVEDFCFAGVKNNILKSPSSLSNDSFIIITSGLSLSSSEDLFSVDLFAEWLTGQLGSIRDQEMQTEICRLIIAGNSVHTSYKSQITNTIVNTDVEENSNTLESIKMLDDVLLDIVKVLEVDVMPGEFDPSNHTLPQQAMHHCIFPKSSQFESFHSVTNPYACTVADRYILGSSGQPVNDIKTLTDFENSLDILESTLQWGHLAPTAPDTLPCYPYYQEDPFIITEQPDIYFAGNQPEFKTKTIELNGRPVLLVCVPTFVSSKTCAMINLRTLECTPFVFNV